MKAIPTEIPEVIIIEPKIFGDDRGFFFESFNQKEFTQATGLDNQFIQDNHSFSPKNVLRGLHYQINNSQGKLVRVVIGEVYDVAIDIRKSSPTFGKWVAVHLSEKNKRMLWIPEGFAHGFLVLSPSAHFLYKTTAYYDPSAERCIKWDDPDLAISWPIEEAPILSPKDANGKPFKEAEYYL